MPFSERKITEAAGYLLKLSGGRQFHMKLLKLLYIADRRAIARWGFFLSEDSHVSMEFGPVLSNTYNLIKGTYKGDFWANHISPRVNNQVRLLRETATDTLSRAEERLLTEVFAEYGDVETFKLSEMTHKEFPEWRDPGKSSIPISPREILKAQDVPDDEIRDILKELRVSENVERALDPA